MVLLNMFSFFFALFILWHVLSDIFLLKPMASSAHHKQGAGSSSGDSYGDDAMEITKEDALFGLIPSMFINLGWMGFIQYKVPTLLSFWLYKTAPLLFAAEIFIVLRYGSEELAEQPNFIAGGLLCLQVYFACTYLMDWANRLWNLCFHFIHAFI